MKALRTRMLLRAAILIGATGAALALAGPAFADNQPRPGGGPLETLIEETLTTVVEVVDPILPDPEPAPRQEQPTPVRDLVDAVLPDRPGEDPDEPKPTPVRDAIADIRDQPSETSAPDDTVETPGPATDDGSSPQQPADLPPAPVTPTVGNPGPPATGATLAFHPVQAARTTPVRTAHRQVRTAPSVDVQDEPNPVPDPTSPDHKTVTGSSIASHTTTNPTQPDVTITSGPHTAHPTADRIRSPNIRAPDRYDRPDPAPG